MHTPRLLAAIATLVAAGTAHADRASEIHALGLSPQGEAAVATLLDVHVFGGWAVGAAASPTPGVKALRELVKEPHAADALAYLGAHATLEGQLMALAGLHDVDHAAFDKAVPAYRSIKLEVRVWETGCKGSEKRPVAAVIDAPTRGAFDIASGEYSRMFRERKKTP